MSTEEPFLVPPPFDKASDGDYILTTPDGTRFKIFHYILRLASSVFTDMFSMPRPPTFGAKLPVINVAEDPQTVLALLTLLYPIQLPIVDDYDFASDLSQACDKYLIGLDRLRVLPSLRPLLTDPVNLKQSGLRAYALAWKLGLEEEARTASRYLHAVDLSNRKVVLDLSQESGSQDAMLALWELRLRREVALTALVDLFPLRKWLCHNCTGGDKGRFSSKAEAAYQTKKQSLRSGLRCAMQAPYPSCEDMQTFIDWKRIFCDFCPRVSSLEVSAEIQHAIQNYPRMISGFPIGQ